MNILDKILLFLSVIPYHCRKVLLKNSEKPRRRAITPASSRGHPRERRCHRVADRDGERVRLVRRRGLVGEGEEHADHARDLALVRPPAAHVMRNSMAPLRSADGHRRPPRARGPRPSVGNGERGAERDAPRLARR